MSRFTISRRRSRGNYLAVLCLLAIATCVSSANGEPLPYEARIVVPAAKIQSGPSDAFYATDTLPEGAMVEVHRQESNGWYAIRPPQASFSWVHGNHLKLLDNGLAQVNKEDISSRIGSRLCDNRNAVQVRLKQGEVLQVLGQETLDGQVWYKIAPPAGEFRWIHTSSIQRIAPTHAAATDIITVAGTDAANSSPTAARSTPETTNATDAANSNWRASVETKTEPKAIAGSGPSDADQPTNAARTAPTLDSTANSPGASGVSSPAGQSNANAASELMRQAADIELRLSRAVTGPPASWNIDSLQREAEQLLAQVQTSEERDNVKTTLAKLDRFAAIQNRYARSAANPLLTGIAGSTASVAQSVPTPLVPPGVSASAFNSGHETIGILRPVVSKRPGAPQYALVDDHGQVACFVTPAPDADLRPFLGHRVSVVGNRGFIPEFHRAHYTAGRVMPLGDRIVR
jgi:hypothetical protein